EPVDRRIAGQDLVVVLVAQAETEAEEWWLCRRQRTRCARSFRQSARDVHPVPPDLYAIHKTIPKQGPGLPDPCSDRSEALGRRELALGRGALVLAHGRKALTLAGILALAGVRRALARALALAGVRTHALAFVGGIGGGGR